MKFILILCISLLVILTNFSFAQIQISSGDVSGTWTAAGSPYLIQGEITVPYDSTLSIEPGVLVEFQGHYKLNVQGRLLAVGTVTDTIVFTINDTTGFSNINTSAGGWHGIRFIWTSNANDSSKIIYCKLQYGKAVGYSWADQQGGAVFMSNFDKVQISNCLIANNSVSGAGYSSGGGIMANMCNLCVDNCTFFRNTALDTLGSGGAIMVGADTTYTGFPYQVNISNSHFIANAATRSGAGVKINNWGSDSLIINVNVDKCEFINNVSDHSTGLYVKNSNFAVSNSIFIGNRAVRFAAGVSFYSISSGTVSNCLIASNIAATGGGNMNSGGVSVWGGANVDFMNCTFANNSAAYGAGLTTGYGGNATTTNCIFWGNNKDQIALVTYNNVGSTLDINYCDVQDGIDSVNVDSLCTLNWDIGNIDSDPFFVNAGNGDYHLQDNSPCIGAGIDSIQIGGIWHYCPTCDCEGNTRPNPPGSMPDMGAYENPLGFSHIELQTDLFPKQFKLFQNYPNPFNPNTNIKFTISKFEYVTLKIYNLLGQEVATLVSDKLTPGIHKYTWDATDFASGVYYYRIETNDYSTGSGPSFVKTKKLIVLK